MRCSIGGDSYDREVRELCAPTADVDSDVLTSGDPADIADSLERVTKVHVELLRALEDLDPPPEREASFDAYVTELVNYVDAMKRGYIGEEDDDRAALAAIVDGAESGIALRELADDASLPGECPPLAGTNVHNTLFVAKANLGCFDLGEDVLSSGPIEMPDTARQISLVLELGRRVSAGIAGVIRRADSSAVEEIPVDELVKANRERFKAVEDLADAFGAADYGVYKKASSRLERVSRRADRLALSVGLIHCANVFNLLPF